MAQTISTEGLDIFIDGQTIEMRIHGVRKTSNTREGARLFHMVRTDDIKGVIFDGRYAIYQLSALEFEERCRLFARMCRGRAVAYVDRPYQDDQVKKVVNIHHEMGSPSRIFRSMEKARHWIAERTLAQDEG